VPGFIIKTEAPLVAEWIERISLHRQSRQPNPPSTADEDDIPATLLPILTLLLTDFGPILHVTLTSVLAFLSKNPHKEIPRHFRPAPFRLHLGAADVLAEGTRNVSTHCVWMLQRILDRSGAGDDARRTFEDVLRSVDAEAARRWHETVELWRRGGWRVVRNGRNQLVGERVEGQSRL
jgi:hypothetical protein